MAGANEVMEEQNLLLDALIAAVRHTASGRGRWSAWTNSLQLVCLDLCRACRECSDGFGWRVMVTADTPVRWWVRGELVGQGREGFGAPRIPPLPVETVTLEDYPADILGRLSDGEAWRGAGRLGGGDEQNGGRRLKCWSSRGLLRWPGTVRELVLGASRTFIGGPIERFPWPPFLQVLTFGDNFDQPIEGVVWPAFLERLEFGRDFNQPISGVTWPEFLRELTFGYEFNQPLDRVEWPASLEALFFGDKFNKPIVGAVWPPSLQKLKIGKAFDQPVVGIVWPASLKKLTIGGFFNKPIVGVVWPASLESLSIGGCFNQPIVDVVWPRLLKEVRFDWGFNQSLVDVVWPASLKTLALG